MKKQRKPQRLEADLQAALHLHDQMTGSFRGELASRTAGEVAYDDFLLALLKSGKDFQAAFIEANQAFPSEALSTGGEDLEDVEAHYRFLLDMEIIDETRREVARRAKEPRAPAEKGQLAPRANPLPGQQQP